MSRSIPVDIYKTGLPQEISRLDLGDGLQEDFRYVQDVTEVVEILIAWVQLTLKSAFILEAGTAET